LNNDSGGHGCASLAWSLHCIIIICCDCMLCL